LLLLLLRFRRVFSLERFFFFDLFFVGAKKKEKSVQNKKFSERERRKKFRVKIRARPHKAALKRHLENKPRVTILTLAGFTACRPYLYACYI